jgi:hypothetical protein
MNINLNHNTCLATLRKILGPDGEAGAFLDTMGRSCSWLWRLTSDQKLMTKRTACEIAIATGVNPEWLLSGDFNTTPTMMNTNTAFTREEFRRHVKYMKSQSPGVYGRSRRFEPSTPTPSIAAPTPTPSIAAPNVSVPSTPTPTGEISRDTTLQLLHDALSAAQLDHRNAGYLVDRLEQLAKAIAPNQRLGLKPEWGSVGLGLKGNKPC